MSDKLDNESEIEDIKQLAREQNNPNEIIYKVEVVMFCKIPPYHTPVADLAVAAAVSSEYVVTMGKQITQLTAAQVRDDEDWDEERNQGFLEDEDSEADDEDQNMWRRERAQELGMGLGVAAHNEAMGHGSNHDCDPSFSANYDPRFDSDYD